MGILTEIGEGVLSALQEAMGEAAAVVESKAKARAPVRSIFNGPGYRIETMSARQVRRERRIRDKGLRTGVTPDTVVLPGNIASQSRNPVWLKSTVGTKKPPRLWGQRRLSNANRLLDQYDAEMNRRKLGKTPSPTMLSARGAYEVRSKRAVYSVGGHLSIGGRLRGEITATPPKVRGSRIETWVLSPTPYAKFMEFGTRHNAAHPFLRPAAEESRSEVVSTIAQAVRASLTSADSVELTVVVRI